MNKINNNLKGTVVVVLSAIGFGSYGIFSRYLQDLPLFMTSAIRYLFITVVFLFVIAIKRNYKKIEKKDFKWFFLSSFLGIFTAVPLIYAFQIIDFGLASILFYSALTISAFICGKIFFNEKFNLIIIISLVLSLLGILVIFGTSFTNINIFASLCAIFSGVVTAGGLCFTKKISTNYSTAQVNFFLFLPSVPFYLLLSLIFGENINLYSYVNDIVPFILFFFVVLFSAQFAVLAYKYLNPSVAAILGLLEIVFSAIFGLVLFNQNLSIEIIVGGLLIIIASALPSIPDLFLSSKSKASQIA